MVYTIKATWGHTDAENERSGSTLPPESYLRAKPPQVLPPGSDPSLPQPTPGPLSFPVSGAVTAMSVLAPLCQQCAVPAFVSKAVPGRRAGRGGMSMAGITKACSSSSWCVNCIVVRHRTLQRTLPRFENAGAEQVYQDSTKHGVQREGLLHQGVSGAKWPAYAVKSDAENTGRKLRAHTCGAS